MRKQLILYCICLIGLSFGFPHLSFSQRFKGDPDNSQYLDSLNRKLISIDRELKLLGNKRDPKLYHLKKEMDFTSFLIQFENLVINEDLEKAEDIVEVHLKEAKFRKDHAAIGFYGDLETRIEKEIKLQKIYYQNLFKNEKIFKKELYEVVGQENKDGLLDGLKMLNYAIKFASENRFDETLNYLKKYKIELEYKLYDEESAYDLKKLTSKEKYFLEVFIELVDSDSLENIQRADSLLSQSLEYARYMNTRVDTIFLIRQKLRVATAYSDYIRNMGLKQDLSTLTNQAVLLRRDTLNPNGVYKFNDFIVVINVFNPQSQFENVRRGEAVINADKLLADYIRANDMGELNSGDEIGETIFIDYYYHDKQQPLYFDENKNRWQYMIAYKFLKSPEFTESVRKYLPPAQLEEN